MIRCMIFLIILLAAPVSAAEIYQWTDAQGQVQITDYPPPIGGKLIDSRKAAPIDPREIAINEQRRQYDSQMGDYQMQLNEQNRRDRAWRQRAVERAKIDLEHAKIQRRRMEQWQARGATDHNSLRLKEQDLLIERIETFIAGN
jgi:hypothetical protein